MDADQFVQFSMFFAIRFCFLWGSFYCMMVPWNVIDTICRAAETT